MDEPLFDPPPDDEPGEPPAADPTTYDPAFFEPHQPPALGDLMEGGCMVREGPDAPPRAVTPGYGLPEDPADHIVQLREVEALARFAEIRRVALVADLVEAAPPVERERVVGCGGEGTPDVPEFLPMEIGAALGMATERARLLVSDALDLKWRHPRLWNRMVEGDMPPWRALTVARMCHGLTLFQVTRIDDAVGDELPDLAWARARRLVEGEIAAADPVAAAERERARLNRRHVGVGLRLGATGAMDLFGVLDVADARQLDATLARMSEDLAKAGDESDLDARRARALGLLACGGLQGAAPVVHLYLHAWADGEVARLEGHGPLPVGELGRLLERCTVRFTRVIDHRESVPTDAYEVPPRMREQLNLAQPYEVSPFGSVRARHSDMDHTVPFAMGGETAPHNLGPLGRASHRARTHGGYALSQPTPGRWQWRTPRGQCFEVTNRGTRRLPG
ncbi:hypothetical protein GA0111570_11271 [Raineyella antarctica]|uniref:DUF222 domain-containing protein n=1 Tax=Raineyella antarctica TaxID=1577474 RepID=A0A1G6HSJ2_9ACTN|nr:hypothetical protein [Raineyella antarctica]SDB97123.1 hypothetical protein GA0111570_11271 [Raineyella antarctica]